MTIDRTKKMEAKINYKKFLKMAKNKINEPEPDHPRLRFFLCFFVALFLLEVIPLRHIIDMHPENKDTLKYSDTMMDERPLPPSRFLTGACLFLMFSKMYEVLVILNGGFISWFLCVASNMLRLHVLAACFLNSDNFTNLDELRTSVTFNVVLPLLACMHVAVIYGCNAMNILFPKSEPQAKAIV